MAGSGDSVDTTRAPMVSLTERDANALDRWCLAGTTESSSTSWSTRTYQVPQSLWEAFEAAKIALIEAESAIDFYIEAVHEEGDEWSGR